MSPRDAKHDNWTTSPTMTGAIVKGNSKGGSVQCQELFSHYTNQSNQWLTVDKQIHQNFLNNKLTESIVYKNF